MDKIIKMAIAALAVLSIFYLFQDIAQLFPHAPDFERLKEVRWFEWILVLLVGVFFLTLFVFAIFVKLAYIAMVLKRRPAKDDLNWKKIFVYDQLDPTYVPPLSLTKKLETFFIYVGVFLLALVAILSMIGHYM